jgi:uncharacterized protein YjbJ (UPF0337 family)
MKNRALAFSLGHGTAVARFLANCVTRELRDGSVPFTNRRGYDLGGGTMNRDVLKGNWTQLKGKVRRQWGKLTDDDVERIKGNRDILIGKLQEHYGRTRQQAEEDLERWLDAEDREGRGDDRQP